MTHPTQLHERLVKELRQAPDQVNLARAALYVAQEEYPDLDIPAHLEMIGRMAETLGQRLPKTSYPLKLIRAINQYLFEDLNFRGNTADYYDPRNSFLNDVLHRRVGIPITLSLVYLELAQRIGFPMVGVGMPGHFLIRPTGEDMAIFVDPFHQGEILFEQDCRDRFQHLFGDGAPFSTDHLTPITPTAFVVRILANLKMIYLQQRNVAKALDAINRILLISPEATGEWRDRGLIHYQQGQNDKALLDLQRYLYESPNATDAYEIRRVIQQIERVQDD
ncbi:tetratricopeptide repeat protein [Phormidium sp. FACHB-1136]|jgi:regulator of sirC expression with transglutaminase-like and TPR domain|uniref:SirB1 family protein n=1 Tax=Phormidium sp. FACHB-1136 TaxID=2692848 RepID=UPI0016843F80|nr:tetratricopeptide repeat protein [Phormidium sp. FACHB-1136]MBD2426363.1 tetratricopeptide repeat protein [Phormidium sp. FACHB-1136]